MVNWTKITTPDQLLGIANDNTGGSFWTVATYLVWVVMLMGLLPFGFEVALITASFATLVIAILLVYAGLIAWEAMLFFVGVLLFYVIYIIWSDKKDN